MVRRALLAAVAALVLAVASVSAAPPFAGTATVSIDDATPEYGQTIILTATVDAEGVTQMRTVCTHDFGQSFGFSSITGAETYTDDVGLYAPNWPEGAASCVTSVVVWRAHGVEKTIGSLAFEVAA